ncbi:hypothetical protein Pcinc_037656, partial [Petrolisthes cinctipes]
GEARKVASVAGERGQTGHYTLKRLQGDSAQVWCWARNAVGTQLNPCRFIVTSRGVPGSLSRCKVTNHTASGFRVTCVPRAAPDPLTRYTILIYTQSKSEDKTIGGGDRTQGSSVSSPSNTFIVKLER